MGNSSSSPPTLEDVNNAFDARKNGVAKAFDPNENGIANQFDPNGNGFMGKIKDSADDAFKKGGIGNNMLRKAGDIADDISSGYDSAGDALLLGGTGADLVGLPEIGVPAQAIGAALKAAAPIVKKGGSIARKTADVIEKPKKELDPKKDIANIFY